MSDINRNTTTLTTQDVAAALKCSLATARQIMHRQDFPLIKAGKNLRVSLPAFENWLQQRRV